MRRNTAITSMELDGISIPQLNYFMWSNNAFRNSKGDAAVLPFPESCATLRGKATSRGTTNPPRTAPRSPRLLGCGPAPRRARPPPDMPRRAPEGSVCAAAGAARGAGGAMGKEPEHLERAQVKKAVEALLAYASSKAKGDALLLNESESVHLLVTVWKVPRVAQVIKIPLPHGIRPETAEVCLFTKDEPNLSAEQTENFYRKLLIQNGIRSVSQIISYKTLKKEYKMFEAKRRLLNRFDLFLSDDRIRRLLPSHLGKHFYERKKAPLSVNLKARNLAKEVQKRIQGTTLPVTNKGCCYTARIGHTGMKADEILDNIIAAAEVIAKKLPKNWKNVKILHLKTLKSVALPIFTANISNLDELDSQPSLKKKEVKKGKNKKPKKAAKELNSSQVTLATGVNAAATQEPVIKEKVVQEPGAGDDDEEIPQLVPMQTTILAELKKMEQRPERGENLGKKAKPRLGKRKKQSLAQETPKTKHKVTEECADLQTSPNEKKAKQLSLPKEAANEKEMKKTPKKPEAKSFAAPKAGKSIQSAKKSSKAPKKARKPQSA